MGETFSLCSRRDKFSRSRYFIYENCQCHDPLWYFENSHAQMPWKIHVARLIESAVRVLQPLRDYSACLTIVRPISLISSALTDFQSFVTSTFVFEN